MLVVDSSVWIDFFADRPTVACGELERLLQDGHTRLVVPDLVLFEVLRGFRHERALRQARLLLQTLSVELCGGEDLALAAAEHYRHLRARGITVRSAIDVMVAAFCIENDYLLLHSDRDYDALAEHRGLRVWGAVRRDRVQALATMTLTDYFTRLARYHAWATERLLDSALRSLSDDEWHRDRGLFFGSVHGTVSHLLVTDGIWWSRFALGESPRIALDAVLHAEREPLVAALQADVPRWRPWAAALTAERFDGELHYTRGNGEVVRLPFTPTLGHVFNHATHHRGQLTAALTALGLESPELDWVRLLQQEAASTS